jgi:hypothetical protein
MSIYSAQAQEWTQSLRNMTAIGASIATLVLVPPAFPVIPIATPPARQVHIKIITTIPDGIVDPRTLYFSTSQGLNTGIYFAPSKLDKNEEFQKNNLPQMVREISGLPVDTLADLVGVSRVAYHKWLASGGVKPENVAQLTKLLDAFQTLRNLHVPDLRVFLESVGPSGKPLDLLASGDIHAVIGLALRSSSQSRVPSTLSDEAHQTSGLTGWIRPAKKLNWNAPQLTGSEREDALDLLSPRPLPNEVFVVDDNDEDH